MARPKKYTQKYLSELVESFEEYINETPIPILKEWCLREGVPHRHIYDYAEFSDSIKKCSKKNGRSSKKKYEYDTSTGEYAALAKYRQIPEYRIRVCVTSRIRDAIKRNAFKASATKAMKDLPYTLNQLMRHLESMFQPGMTWGNYGEWHIDHIKPVSAFEYSSTSDDGFIECWSLNNLQPLWARDNIRKGAKVS